LQNSSNLCLKKRIKFKKESKKDEIANEKQKRETKKKKLITYYFEKFKGTGWFLNTFEI